MNLDRTRLFVTLALCGILGLVARLTTACSTCERGESRCDGKTLLRCEYACEDCDLDWMTTACTGQCVSEGPASAFCAVSEGPDALCDGRAAYCAADMRMYCRSGYRVAEERCEPPLAGGTAECREYPGGLACSSSGNVPPAGAAPDGGVDAQRHAP